MKPAAGDLIGGKYRIVRVIGDGGMGTVYEAQHEFLETSVALKFLHSELAKRPGLGSRFLQEARVSARIRSVHVTHVTDVDQTPDGSPYLVMELLHGESLQAALDRRGKIPVEQAIDFGLQILSGLESAHAIGVVHRDLKPDNVFIVPATGGPLLKLIDFGIAKLRASTAFQKGLTRAGVIMGTPEYMAPEQLFAAESVDHRADLYSLGVILFEMLAGRRPTDGDDVEAIVAAVVSGNVRRLQNLEPSLSPGLVAVVERALRPDREGRFASAFEMRLALAPFALTLSQAGRAAATPEALVMPPRQAGSSAPPQQTGVAQGFRVERAVPKTLPPDPEAARANQKGKTQEASDETVREALRASALPGPAQQNLGYSPNAFPAPRLPEPMRRRRSRASLWVVLGLLLTLLVVGGVLGAVFYQEREPDPSVAPLVLDTATPDTTVSALVDTSATAPPAQNPGATAMAVTPSRPTPNPGAAQPGNPVTTAPRKPVDAGAAPTVDAGRVGFPFPFALPSTIPPLPTTIPPLPSTFPPLPKTFPTAFPTAFPSGFPQIPGFPLGRPAQTDAGK